MLKVTYPATFIEFCVRRSLPWLFVQEANAEVVRLTIENIRLQAEVEKVELERKYR